MMTLLEAGADPLLRDSKGQDVPLLIDGLRAKMPPVPQLLQRRMALEQVAAVLTRRLYDEVEVAGVLEEREGADGGEREFLVQFKVRRGCSGAAWLVGCWWLGVMWGG